MISQTALAGFTVPIRWTPSTNSKSAISILEKVLSRSTPALATRTSMRPQASMAVLTISATPASSVTEEPLAMASPPSALISSTTLWAASEPPPEPSTETRRSLTTPRAPRRASSSACWRPRPPPEPVTMATLPSKRMSAMGGALSGSAAGIRRALCGERPGASTSLFPPLHGEGKELPRRRAVRLGLLLRPHELHQDALADQEGGAVGGDHDLHHAFLGAFGGIVALQPPSPR